MRLQTDLHCSACVLRSKKREQVGVRGTGSADAEEKMEELDFLHFYTRFVG